MIISPFRRTPKRQELTELATTRATEMDAPAGPAMPRRFEVRGGIEMVPGTVHLVDGMLSRACGAVGPFADSSCDL